MRKFNISKKALRKISLGMVAAFMAVNMTACATFDNFKNTFITGDGPQTEDTIKIGVFEPMSGKDKENGQLEVIGIELAHELFPTALGKKIELVYGDNKSDMYIAESIAKELVDKDVALVLGSYGSSNSLIAVKTFEEAKVPAIAITNTNPLVTSYNPFYFRVCLLESFQGVALAKYAVEEMGALTTAIMTEANDDFATAIANTYYEQFITRTNNSNALLVSCDYKESDTDFKEPLKKIKEAQPDVVFLPADAEQSALILKQAKQMGITSVFLGTDRWDTEDFAVQMKLSGMENVSFSTIFDPDTSTTSMSESFLRAYQAKYGADSVPDSAVALGFDAYLIAIDALNKAGTTDGEKLRNSIAYTQSFPGASGNITFDVNGDPIKSVVVKTVSGGAVESIYTMEPQVGQSGE